MSCAFCQFFSSGFCSYVLMTHCNDQYLPKLSTPAPNPQSLLKLGPNFSVSLVKSQAQLILHLKPNCTIGVTVESFRSVLVGLGTLLQVSPLDLGPYCRYLHQTWDLIVGISVRLWALLQVSPLDLGPYCRCLHQTGALLQVSPLDLGPYCRCLRWT